MLLWPTLAEMRAEMVRRQVDALQRQLNQVTLDTLYGHHFPGGVVKRSRVEIDLDPEDYREVGKRPEADAR